MADRKPLDRADIEQAFRIMGEYLVERKALGEIAIYGGSAILFQFDWRRTSEDVDARVIGASDHGLIMQAADAAARQLDLPRSWFNESVTMYARRLEGEQDRVFIGVYPSAGRVGLRVVAAKPNYLLAMKLSALERATIDDRDFEDVVRLATACGVCTVDELRENFRNFFPDQQLPAAAELRLSSISQAVQAKPRN